MPERPRPLPGPADPGWLLPAAAWLLAASVLGLSWLFAGPIGGLAYLVVYLLATLPGLPVGFALFGRRHAAGWIAGGVLGYMLTAVAIWAVVAVGMPRVMVFLAAWAVLSAATWAAYLALGREPVVLLPRWCRQDTLAVLVVLLMVPALMGPTVGNIGARDEMGQERYRAYFTADFLWHAALTAELARFEMPPKDPYAGDRDLSYYWAYFLLPGAAFGTNPGGLWRDPQPILKVNSLLSGLLFFGVIAVFVWTCVPRAGAMAAAVALSALAGSAEGTFAMASAWSAGRSLTSLRELNIDAVTAWVFRGLTIDGLPRSLWYTPQHAMACGLGLVALIVAAASPRGVRRGALLAGLALGLALLCSPFLGGAFSLIYGLGVLCSRHGSWSRTLQALMVHALAAIPVGIAYWCASSSQMFEGAGAALSIGYAGPITRAPLVTPLLALGPLLAAALGGLVAGRSRFATSMAPVVAGVVVGAGLLYFVTLPGGDVVWIGWRAGQILLLTLTPLAAAGMARVQDARRLRPLMRLAYVMLFAVGLPTTVIDTYNAQDVWNRMMGPGFRWTVVVTPAERHAVDWIRAETSPDAIVQMEPVVRGRETWTHIPTFALRRMAAGLPISLLKKPVYEERSLRVREMYGTEDPRHAWNIAKGYHIDYLYMDSAERRAYGTSLEKFDDAPQYFARVFREGDVSIYRVVDPE